MRNACLRMWLSCIRCHLLLLDLVVNDVAGGQLAVNVLYRNTHLGHEHHDVVGKVSDLVDRLLLVTVLSADDDLSAFLAHLLKDLVQTLVKEVGKVK